MPSPVSSILSYQSRLTSQEKEQGWHPRKVVFKAYNRLFAVLAVLILVIYACGGREPLWNVDALEQYLPYFIFTGETIREFFVRLFTGQDVSALMWDQTQGFGADALASNDTVWNPLNWISALIPSRFAEYGLMLTIFARLYLAGAFFILYCLYRERGRFATLCGALVYSFSGTALMALVWPGGADALVLFPLLLLGTEKVLHRESPLLFIVSIFLFFLISYYFSYAACLFLLAYCIVRVFGVAREQGERVTVKSFVGWTLRFAGYLCIGVACAAVSLVPQLLALFGTDRATDAQTVIPLLYSFDDYTSWLSGFISYSSVGSDCSIGFTGAALVAVTMLFCECKRSTEDEQARRRNRTLAITFIVLIVFMLVPAVGSFFNGMNYATNRWIWALAFCVSYIIATAMPSLEQTTQRQKKTLAIVAGVYAFILVLIPATRSERTMAALAGLALFVAVVFAASRLSRTARRNALCAALVACLSISTLYICSSNEGGSGAAGIPLFSGYSKLTEESANAVVAQIDDSSWWRYDADPKESNDPWVRVRNSSMVLGLNGIDFYNSIYNSRIDAYQTELGIVGNGMNFSYENLGGRSMLMLLNNVKYYLKQTDGSMNRAYNYDDASRVVSTGIARGAECSATQGDVTLPLGYTYNAVINRSDYEQMTTLEKQQALMQGAVLEDCIADTSTLSTLSDETLSLTDTNLGYSIASTAGVRVENGAFVADRAGASVTLSVQGQPQSETYVMFEGLNFEAYSAYDVMSTEQLDAMSWYKRIYYKLQDLQFLAPTSYKVHASSDTSPGIRTIGNFTAESHLYGGKTDWALDLGYSDGAPSTITLTFSTVGRYSFDSLSIAAQPMGAFNEQAAALGETCMVDTVVDGGHVTGTITLNETKRLYLSMPWSEGWTAWVDGVETDIDLTNTAFMSFELPAGTHSVELRYTTPGLAAGAIISACGLIAFAVLMLVRRKRERVREMSCYS